eukprot:CAMPEP_0167777406 /NCGR_PEP_ID=MMETSP0111_2-20121227/3679_1 /TAXON_ID=91324 /ORGANISM="Lotharella globosa, Strain CCCM811" /LENGTH=145 /DNA_ID=CAMNT_0007667593 /DNA_START=43 /DNA_END=480 /DNA_ORIENTATION=-
MNKKLVKKFAKGFRGRAKNCVRIARNRVEKALQHSYRGRKQKKRDAREAWIMQVNAGCTQYGVSYNTLISGMKVANIELNRKMLAELAQNEPLSFQSIIAHVKPQVKPARTARMLEEAGYIGMRLGNPPDSMSEETKDRVYTAER